MGNLARSALSIGLRIVWRLVQTTERYGSGDLMLIDTKIVGTNLKKVDGIGVGRWNVNVTVWADNATLLVDVTINNGTQPSSAQVCRASLPSSRYTNQQ